LADIGTGYIRIAPNMTGIQGKIAGGMKGAGAKATRQLGEEVNSNSGGFKNAIGKLGGIAKTGGLAIAGGMAVGIAGLAALTGKALQSGAELEQQLGGADAVFGEYASSIKQSAEDAFSESGLSMNEFLQGANKMGSLFQGAGFSVKDSMEMSSDSMQRASDVASIMGIDTTSALEAVAGMAKGNFTMMDNLGVAMNDTSIQAFALEQGITKSTSAMSAQEKIGLAQQMFMQKTAKYAGNYAKENASLSGSINTTKKAFDNLMTGEGDIDGFIEMLLNTIELAVPKIIDLLPKIVTGISAVLSALVPAIAKALPVLIPALIGAVVTLIQSLVAAMPMIIGVLLEALPLVIDGFITLFIAILQALPEIVKTIANAIPTIIDSIVNGLTNPESLNAIIMGAVDLLLALVEAIPIIIPALIGAIPIILRNIVQVLTSPAFIRAMINAGVQLLQAQIQGMISMGGSVASAAWDIIGIIKDTLSPSNLWGIGTDVVKGLWHGIQSMGGWIKDKVIGFVKDKIPAPVRKALGINSPSKVFAEIGRHVDEGLVKGIEDNSFRVKQSVKHMTDQALAGVTDPSFNPSVAFSGSTSGGGTLAGGGATTNKTISIGNISLGSTGAVQEFFRQLNQDTINVGMGLTPVQGNQ